MRKPIPYSCPICGNRLPRAASRCFFCEYPLPMNKGAATQSAWSSPRRIHPEALRKHQLPSLHIAAQDFGRLENLAHIAGAGESGLSLLRSELDRATVCDDVEMPHGVVRMGSTVVLRDRGEDDSMQKLRAILVYPGECNRSLPSISVASPLGAAILGLSVGEVMRYEGPGGVRHVVTILSVVRPDVGENMRAGGPADHDERQHDPLPAKTKPRPDEPRCEGAGKIVPFQPVKRPQAPRPSPQRPSDLPTDPPPAA